MWEQRSEHMPLAVMEWLHLFPCHCLKPDKFGRGTRIWLKPIETFWKQRCLKEKEEEPKGSVLRKDIFQGGAATQISCDDIIILKADPTHQRPFKNWIAEQTHYVGPSRAPCSLGILLLFHIFQTLNKAVNTGFISTIRFAPWLRFFFGTKKCKSCVFLHTYFEVRSSCWNIFFGVRVFVCLRVCFAEVSSVQHSIARRLHAYPVFQARFRDF
jgi:hypothetical protein